MSVRFIGVSVSPAVEFSTGEWFSRFIDAANVESSTPIPV